MLIVVVALLFVFFFFFNDTATTEIYTLSLHDALPISSPRGAVGRAHRVRTGRRTAARHLGGTHLLYEDLRHPAGRDVPPRRQRQRGGRRVPHHGARRRRAGTRRGLPRDRNRPGHGARVVVQGRAPGLETGLLMQTQRGFTLIEVMVAVVILSVGLLGTAQWTTGTVHTPAALVRHV